MCEIISVKRSLIKKKKPREILGRVRVLNWPAGSPDLSPLGKKKKPRTVQQLESYITQQWDNIPLPKLQQLVSSLPRHSYTVAKRRRDATQW